MILELIKKYCQDNKIDLDKFEIIPGYWTNDKFSSGLKSGNSTVFITEFNGLVSIEDASDFGNDLFIIESSGKSVNYKHLVTFENVAGAVQIKSNHISIHNSNIEFITMADPIYSSIYSAHFKYFLLKPKLKKND